jgi:ATP-dependent DNA helicase RecG
MNILESCKLIRPEYLPIVEVVNYENKNIIVIWAHGGYARPRSSPKTMAKREKLGVNWIRKMASTIKLSKEEE